MREHTETEEDECKIKAPITRRSYLPVMLGENVVLCAGSRNYLLDSSACNSFGFSNHNATRRTDSPTVRRDRDR